ncbi:alpha/beta hydrolase [Streptomyces malaysiensis]|uniref:Alpha/beta hydrolase n=1 Tax=Streptomyces malaysiensis subsp. samsunensis TaxID=459658 RepID=A0A9X2M5N6_STRMQ|nr:alpha/beta hydrolase [Streptomyces samsunensis]MCQ8835584.1 alpha/beta hydrolase [Streptomyces samsunensis]
MKRQRIIGVGVALAALLGFGASPAPALTASAAAADRPPAQVQWGACPDDVVAEAAPTKLDCATVPVPVDYTKPKGDRIDLMVSRLASTTPKKRRGILMLNPGGPGGSGLTLSAVLVRLGLPASVTDAYDIIGMDTRGVGHSGTVSCGFTDDSPYYSNIPPYAVDDAAVTAQAKIVKQVAEQCASHDRDDRLRHLTTANMARDLDRIRAALGEKKTSFLGYSYGSALGAAYASMFPKRSDRIVLDSNIGDTHLDRDGLRRFALGMEDTFPDFAKWAAARHDTYGLGATPAQVRETYFSIAERLDKEPEAGLDGGLFRLSTFGDLFAARLYPELAEFWQSMLSPTTTATRQSTLSRTMTATRQSILSQTTTATTSAPSPYDNFLSVFVSVTCNDVKWPQDIDTYRRAVAEDRIRYPLFGAAAANITPCAFWPHSPAEPPVAINDEGPRNVLIVQNLHDVPTPHRGGELLRQKFEDRSRLLSVDGSGHGVYVVGRNSCALSTTTRFLVKGVMPAKDMLCSAG